MRERRVSLPRSASKLRSCRRIGSLCPMQRSLEGQRCYRPSCVAFKGTRRTASCVRSPTVCCSCKRRSSVGVTTGSCLTDVDDAHGDSLKNLVSISPLYGPALCLHVGDGDHHQLCLHV